MSGAYSSDVESLASDVFGLIESRNAEMKPGKAEELAITVRDRVVVLQQRAYVNFMALAFDLVDRLCGFAPDQLAEERDSPRRQLLSKNLSALLQVFHGYRNLPKTARSKR